MAEAEALNFVSQANQQFTFDLYNVLAQEPGNLFFSPVSIQVILALLFLGAREETAKQLAKGLRLSNDRSLIENGVNALMHRLQDSNEVMLDIANRVYLKPGFGIKEDFNRSAIKFMAGVEEVDFAQEGARKTINDWVEKVTKEKIKDLIPPGYLDERTRMVLVNAIYFKGEWLKQFKQELTTPSPFRLSPGVTKRVDMMFTEDRFKYIEIKDLNSQFLLLPYKGKRLSMMIILPREVDGLPGVEKKIASINVGSFISKMYETDTYVFLPKFKLEFEKELPDTLRKLGITSIFDATADLRGISDKRLEVSKAIHKAFIEVNEEGTEAAAATALLAEKIDSIDPQPQQPVIFKADHPFMFCILDHQTGAVLFVGRYTSPPVPSPAETAALAEQFPEYLFARGAVPVVHRATAAGNFPSGSPFHVPDTGP